MLVSDWPDFIAAAPSTNGAAMTVGVFDGVHLGHQALIKAIVNNEYGLESTVITFTRNPKGVFHPSGYAGDICTLAQKLNVLKGLGVSRTVLIDFSENFSKISGKDFINILRDHGNLRYLAVGEGFKCGYRLDTSAELIRAMNEAARIPTLIIAPVRHGPARVSSSRIRAAIGRGSLAEAASLLGRNVELDLSGLSCAENGGTAGFDLSAADRLTPPAGRYRALVYRDDSRNRTEVSPDAAAAMPEAAEVPAEVLIEKKRILIPSGRGARRVEFL